MISCKTSKKNIFGKVKDKMCPIRDAEFAYVGYIRISAANNVYNYNKKMAWWFFSLFILPGYPPASLPPFFFPPYVFIHLISFSHAFRSGKKRSFVWLWQQKKGGGGKGDSDSRRKNLLRKEIFRLLCKCWPNRGHFLNVLLYIVAHGTFANRKKISAWSFFNLFSVDYEHPSSVWLDIFRACQKSRVHVFGKKCFFAILLIFSIYQRNWIVPQLHFCEIKFCLCSCFFSIGFPSDFGERRRSKDRFSDVPFPRKSCQIPFLPFYVCL